MKYLLAITVVVLVYAAETCWAGGEVVRRPDWQIIAESDVVAEGEVVTIFPPPDVSGKVRREFVARIKLATVFKGTVKPGETVDAIYVALRLVPPGKYAVGDMIMVTLMGASRLLLAKTLPMCRRNGQRRPGSTLPDLRATARTRPNSARERPFGMPLASI